MREGKSESEWAERVVFEGLERQRVEVLAWPLDFEESFGTQLRVVVYAVLPRTCKTSV